MSHFTEQEIDLAYRDGLAAEAAGRLRGYNPFTAARTIREWDRGWKDSRAGRKERNRLAKNARARKAYRMKKLAEAAAK